MFFVGGNMWKIVRDFIAVIIGIVSGILTVISFVWSVLDVRIEKLNIVVDLNYVLGNANTLLILFAIMLVCLLYTLQLWRGKIKSKKISESILLQYNHIISIFQKNLFGESADKQGLGYLREIIEQIQFLFKRIYNKSIRVQIKMILEGNESVKVLCSTQAEIEPYEQKIKENSEFISLCEKGDGFFSFSTKNKKSARRYFSSDPKWNHKYASLLVLPIKKAQENGATEIVGFLCLDSINNDTFNEKVRYLLVPLLDTISGYLYLAMRAGAKELKREIPNNLLD